ncbi:MAG TPA: ABC transporter permease [Candidatus Acidoferrum sp.]|nr:ABC transporter permease [Candidatus Acidoferrum sp.]
MLGWLRIVASRIWGLLSPKHTDEDFTQELESHLEMLAQENLRRGMAPEEARRVARVRLGGLTQINERHREMRTLPLLETVVQDVRYRLRALRKSPGFTSVAVLTLALGIGANTAIFTLVHAVLLKPLPVAHPEQLYNLGDDQNCCSLGGSQDSFTLFSYPLYKEIRDHTPEFSEIAAFRSHVPKLSGRRSSSDAYGEPFRTQFVSGNYFSMLGVGAFAGRTLTPTDDEPGAPTLAVMSYRTWQVRFSGEPSVLGRQMILGREPVTVVGIAAPRFFGERLDGDPAELWIPLNSEPRLMPIGSHLNETDDYWLYAIGRLRRGVSALQAQSHLKSEIQHWIAARPNRSGYKPEELEEMVLTLTPASGGIQSLQVDYAAPLRFLTVVSAFVLLIACANIANLLLARGTASRGEIAVRVALGASRARLVQQVVTESVLLALAGGAAGVSLAFLGTRVILLLAFRGSEYVPIEASPSMPVLLFTFMLSLATGVIFGIAPAWAGSLAQPAETLRGAGRSTTDHSRVPQKALLVLQAALSLILLVGAGLATEGLRNLEKQRFGFLTAGRLVVQVGSDFGGYAPERLPSLYQELQERLAAIPGVQSASLSRYSPMEGSNWGDPISIAGHPAPPGKVFSSSLDSVSAHYFETIGTRLVHGRYIDARDTPTSPHVAVISEAFARKYFPNEESLGQHFGIGDASHSGDYEIVGIVEDAKYIAAREAAHATAFLPLLQARENNSNIFHDIQLLVAGSPQNLEPMIRRTLANVDSNLTVLRVIRFDEQVAENFNSERLVARLTTLYGLLALVLACVGLYGVAAYTVTRRTSEIGIRMALGAPRRDILAMVLRVAMAPVALGLLVGLPLALAGNRAIASELYGVKSYDAFVLGTAVLVLIASSIVAALIPARRAARVDPMAALRYE